MKVQEQISTGAFWVFERFPAPPTDYCERLAWGYSSFLVNPGIFERQRIVSVSRWIWRIFRWKACLATNDTHSRPLNFPWESMFGFHVRPEYPRETWFLAFSCYPKQVVRPHSSSERNQVFGRRYLCCCEVGLQPVWFLRIQSGLPPYYWKDSWFWRLWRW